MVAKLDIHGVHFELDDNIKKYLTKKINRLERYVASENRASLHAEFYLKESKAKQGKLCECEAVLHLPKETIRIKETTINMYAAVDIVEEKLRQALKKYKDLHNRGRKVRHLLARVRFESQNN